jgi:EpsI family protein
MGQIRCKSILVLVGLFSLSALLVQARSEPPAARKSVALGAVLTEIQGWTTLGHVALDEKIVRALDLDDYVNTVYSRGADRVSLYIGYYLTTGKVGSAHDPLVCFPGQGWRISGQRQLQLEIPGHPPLNCSMLTAELGQQRELVLYWFQAYDASNADTFRQKLALLWKKLMGSGQDNAFVRITAPLKGQSVTGQQEMITDFIAAFYPLLIDFVHEGNRPPRGEG